MIYPQYNGKALDFASIELTANNRIWSAFTNISYSQPKEEGVLYGTWSEPLARTRGRLKMGEGELKWSAIDEAQEFIDSLGDGYLEQEFEIVHIMSYYGRRLIKRVLYSCCLLDVKDDAAGGVDPIGEDMPFSFLRMTRNGRTQFRNQLR
jgi:hypothetical protein